MMYDCIIIGDGPAAMAAVINLKIREKNFLLMGSDRSSSKVRLSHKIPNYLGHPNVNGEVLIEQLINHVKEMNIDFSDIKANQVFSMGDHFVVSDRHNQQYEAKTVIIAVGIVQESTLIGEDQFLGRGVSYCATCDGHLYKDKTVAVIGQTEESVAEANFLAGIAKKVIFLPIKKLQSKLNENIEIRLKKIMAIEGNMKATTLVLNDDKLELDGIFIIREAMSPTYMVPGVEIEKNHIKVDAQMQTNIKGLYAAGDCTGQPYALMKAQGQGQMAALKAVSFLDGVENITIY